MPKNIDLVALRHRMVEEQIRGRGISDDRILRAMEEIPRHVFVPHAKPQTTYHDGPLPIGQGQTISQPYITAYMTELLQAENTDRILEVGTGSGYQAALLSFLCAEVYSVEIISAHHIRARKLLKRLGYTNAHLKMGDGCEGWPEQAPFDGIVVTAAAKDEVPLSLLDQLGIGGRLVIPIGHSLYDQQLEVYTRTNEGMNTKQDLAVRFVPLVQGE